MMKYFKLIFWMASLLVANACVRIMPLHSADIAAPKEVVVYSFLTPGDSIYAYVALPVAIRAKNAKVWVSLSDSLAEVPLMPDALHTEKYSAPQRLLPIVAGRKYTLKVAVEGSPTLIAHTRVPHKKAVWKSLKMQTGIDSKSYTEVYGTWDAAEDGHYGVGLHLFEDRSVALNHTYMNVINMGKGQQGFKGELYNPTQKTVQAVLITRDIHYQRYSEVYNLTQKNTETLVGSMFSDFIGAFKGQIPSYSNVENGVGILGSFLTDKKNANF